jgi:hypothetical protein
MKRLRFIFLMLLACSVHPVMAQAPSFVAFVQPDGNTKSIPYGAFSVERSGAFIDSRTPLMACDIVHFNAKQREVQQVLITTIESGRNISIDAQHDSAILSCKDGKAASAKMTSAAARAWQLVSGGDRVSDKAAKTAITRGYQEGADNLVLRVFAAPESYLVAGRRSLTLAWAGGPPTVDIELRRASENGELIAQAKGATGNRTELPEVEFTLGTYYLMMRGEAGTTPTESYAIQVIGSDAPPPPSQFKVSGIKSDEQALLYVFYLEGMSNGRWTLEAMQRAAAIGPNSGSIVEWFKTYMK